MVVNTALPILRHKVTYCDMGNVDFHGGIFQIDHVCDEGGGRICCIRLAQAAIRSGMVAVVQRLCDGPVGSNRKSTLLIVREYSQLTECNRQQCSHPFLCRSRRSLEPM